MNLILILIIWLISYHLDMFSALVVRHYKPVIFESTESNEIFKRLLRRYSLSKSILIYDFVYSLQNVILIIIAMTFAYGVLFGFNFVNPLALSFVYMTFAHICGAITNIISLNKDERKI